MMHGKKTENSTADQGRQETTAPQLTLTSDTMVQALTRNTTKKTQYAIPIGIDNFRKLRTTLPDGAPYWFADKSLFIKSITGSGAKITLITRPRRFGKTLNMSML